MGGTYDRDGNSVPYLAATPDMEIQLGQISLTDFDRLAVRATITERENEEAGFYFYLDSETNPLIVARPAETAGNAVSEDVQATSRQRKAYMPCGWYRAGKRPACMP